MSPVSLPDTPSLAEASRFWFKLGWISFGGPAGQIAIMHEELVVRRRWISERRFLHALNYCMLLPGPEAQQLATYLGWLLHRSAGGVIAGALFVLPSLLLLCALSYVYVAHGDLALVRGALLGVKPAVVAIVLMAVWRIGQRSLRHPLHLGLAVGALLALAFDLIGFPLIVLGAAAIGALLARWPGAAGVTPAAHHREAPVAAPALIDDDTPPPAHARFRAGRLALLLALALALWLMLRAGSAAPVLRAMFDFFSGAALLTFGGAYAVLPYVYQGAVETHQWLQPAQMIDGLALGETTPGPLIMVVAFVGFVGAWQQAALGPEALLQAGLAGAALATASTFLPSFVFILGGAPLVESSRHRLGLTAPLAAISAAVVGVIAHLALLFGWHVLWPQASAAQPFAGGFDALAALTAALALLALLRGWLGVVGLVLVCAALGVLRLMLG